MADINPPAWRNGACSTFQHWEFNKKPKLDKFPAPDPDTEPMQPETDKNPYSLPFAPPMDRPWLIVRAVRPPSTEWRPGFAKRKGVWRIEPPDGIFGRIPNAGKDKGKKEIRVQVTYYRTDSDLDVLISDAALSRAPANLIQIVPMANGWTHGTWTWHTTCGVEEILFIECDDVVYIDQVVVDTICECPNRRDPKSPKPKTKRPRTSDRRRR